MGFEYCPISMKLGSNETQVHKRLILLLGMKGEIVQAGIEVLDWEQAHGRRERILRIENKIEKQK